ncbi:E3 ubiquitin-protein ligase RING1-like [Iris pallida]|uniref:RING-type E3 ubiquitin transferase n=1 Tax=Iris pallida TaxID=29817 RepID=A0AAX6HLR8_IRIPA|nr:E3 ubiquitin-protein ligase RING1-like [Iris pallida]
MGEALVGRYYCHLCSQVVSPVLEAEIKCPFCDSGFVEEMTEETAREGLGADEEDDDVGSDRSLSLWAPVLLGMMGNRPRRRRSRLTRMDDESDSDHERELEALLRRRRRSSAILQLLQGLNDDLGLESEAPERERERERARERESVILINPFNQAVILQGTFDSENAQGEESNDGSTGASLGDYFIGPGLDMLLQHLAENDPSRYGTPPAKQEAVDAMPTVEVHENLNCSVCLEDFEIGMGAREMPCKHKFHSGCILPWLELHSSCPVCRFQIPADETKVSNASGGGEGGGDGGDRGDASRPPSISWSLRGLFSSSRSRSGGNASSNPSSSSATSESNSHEDEN